MPNALGCDLAALEEQEDTMITWILDLLDNVTRAMEAAFQEMLDIFTDKR